MAAVEHALLAQDDRRAFPRRCRAPEQRDPCLCQHPPVAKAPARDRRLRIRIGRRSLGPQRHRIAQATRVRERFAQRIRRRCRGDRQPEGREQRMHLHFGQHAAIRGGRFGTNAFHDHEIRRVWLGLRRRHLEQPFLIVPIDGEKRKRLDGIFRCVEVRNTACLERRTRLAALDRSEPRSQHGLRRASRDIRHCARRIGGAGARPLDVQCEHRIDLRIRERRVDRGRQPLLRSVPAHIHRIPADDVRRQHRGEGLFGRRRKVSQHDAAIGRDVGSERTRAVPVGDDRKPVTARDPAHRQNPRGGEELRVGLHADRAGSSHRCFEHGVGRRPVGVATLHRPTGLEHDNGFGPRGLAQRREKSSRVADRLRVEQDSVGTRIEQQGVQQLAEIHVHPAAERNHRRKSDAGRAGEIEHRRADGSRLSDERKPAGMRHDGPVRGVEADVGADHAERMRPQNANAAGTCGRQDIAVPTPRRVGVDRRRGQDNRRLYAGERGIIEDGGDGRIRHYDQRQLDWLADRGRRRVRAAREDPAMTRIDRVERPVEHAPEQGFHDDPAHRSRRARRADERDRGRHQERAEIVG